MFNRGFSFRDVRPAGWLIVLGLSMWSAWAQTNVTTNLPPDGEAHREQVRLACIQGRRSICGKILKVLPEGLVVESGYTNLMRHPVDESWLVPATITASLPPNLLEGQEPGSVGVGLVFLSEIPKSRKAKPRQYDYVVIPGYPAGEYTYASVGTIKRTVRRFSASLSSAVELKLAAEKPKPSPVVETK